MLASVDDREVDIYDDIDDGAAGAAATTVVSPVADEGADLAEHDNGSSDLYNDIYSFETPRELQQAAQIKRLHADVRGLTSKLTEKERENQTLRRNMESLLLTARKEIARKAAELTELQRTVIRYQTGKKLANCGAKGAVSGASQSSSGTNARNAGHSRSDMASLSQGKRADASTAPVVPFSKPDTGCLASSSGQATIDGKRWRAAAIPPPKPMSKQLPSNQCQQPGPGSSVVVTTSVASGSGEKLERAGALRMQSSTVQSSKAEPGRLHRFSASPANCRTPEGSSSGRGLGMKHDLGDTCPSANLEGASRSLADKAMSPSGARSQGFEGSGPGENLAVEDVTDTCITEPYVSKCSETLDETATPNVRLPISTGALRSSCHESDRAHESLPSDVHHAPLPEGRPVLLDETLSDSSYGLDAVSPPSESLSCDTGSKSMQLKISREQVKSFERQPQRVSREKSNSLSLEKGNTAGRSFGSSSKNQVDCHSFAAEQVSSSGRVGTAVSSKPPDHSKPLDLNDCTDSRLSPVDASPRVSCSSPLHVAADRDLVYRAAERVSSYRRNSPNGHRNGPDYRRNAPGERRNAPDERRNAPDERRNAPDERRNAPDDRLGKTPGDRSRATDDRHSTPREWGSAPHEWSRASDFRCNTADKLRPGNLVDQRRNAREEWRNPSDELPNRRDYPQHDRGNPGSGWKASTTGSWSYSRDSSIHTGRRLSSTTHSRDSSNRETVGSDCRNECRSDLDANAEYFERHNRYPSANRAWNSERPHVKKDGQSWQKHCESDWPVVPVEHHEPGYSPARSPASTSYLSRRSHGSKSEPKSGEPEPNNGPTASLKRHRLQSSADTTKNKCRRVDIEDGEVLSENEQN